MGRPNRGDGSAQGLCVLFGEPVDVQRFRAGQFIDRAEVVLGCAQYRDDDVGDVTGCGRAKCGRFRGRRAARPRGPLRSSPWL